MAESKTARVRYSAEDDAFVIEIFDGDAQEWMMSKMFPCVAAGSEGKTDFIHVSIIQEILQLVGSGYYVFRALDY